MRKIISDDLNEDEKILNSYKLVYKTKLSKKPLYWVEDLFFNYLLKFNRFLSNHINSWACRVTNRTKDKYKYGFYNHFTKDYTKTDPIINKLTTLDASKINTFQTKEVVALKEDLAVKTLGKYDKESFKWDLFGHLLKNNNKDLNIT